MTLHKESIDLMSLRNAIRKKAEERTTLTYIENSEKYLKDIMESQDLKAIWISYTQRFPYAQGIRFSTITDILQEVLVGI